MGTIIHRGACAFIAGVIFLSSTAPWIGAAEISVPKLELATVGTVEDGDFVLASRAAAELSIEGGYKFGGLLRLAFESDDLEAALGYSQTEAELSSDGSVSEDEYNSLVNRLKNQSFLAFRLAKVTARELFGLPLEFSYFVGYSDVFCSGDEFPTRFGTAQIGTDFRGFAYFPNGIGGDPSYQYDGIHAAIGTGISLAATIRNRVVPILYVYQNAISTEDEELLGGTPYSADLRVLANGEHVKFEAFAGASILDSDWSYRGGVLAFFTTGTGADFLAQIGVPLWASQEDFSVDNLFFLFEPRIDFGFTSIHVTLFYHPLYYLLQGNDEERGASDVNIKLLFGNLTEYSVEGGMETTFGIRSNAAEGDDTFIFTVAPFIGVVTEGVRWDMKLRVHPLDSSVPLEMFETYIGVRTAY